MKTRREFRLKRKLRIRAKVFGTAGRPRFAVFRSNQRLSAQLVDDGHGVTLVAQSIAGKNQAAGKELGQKLAKAAIAKKITSVVFDRAGFKYHGVIKAIAEGAREGGLKF